MKKFQTSEPIRLPLTFASPEEGIALVKRNEREVDERLTACAAAISADCVAHGVRVIRLSGLIVFQLFFSPSVALRATPSSSEEG